MYSIVEKNWYRKNVYRKTACKEKTCIARTGIGKTNKHRKEHPGNDNYLYASFLIKINTGNPHFHKFYSMEFFCGVVFTSASVTRISIGVNIHAHNIWGGGDNIRSGEKQV